MNRRDFITSAIAVGTVVSLIGIPQVKASTPVRTELEALIRRLANKPNQYIGVVMAVKDIKPLARSLVPNSKVGDHSKGVYSVTLPNGSHVYFIDINNPSRLRGPQFHHSIFVGESKYEETKPMLRLATRMGNYPQIFELP